MILVKFNMYFGRMGGINGLFITTQNKLDKIYNKNIYFGEVLGKHSEVEGKVEASNFTTLTDEVDFIQKLERLVGSKTISGINPLHYDEVEEDEDE